MAAPARDGAVRSGRGGGLYLHVPFCRSLCPYCHFARTAEHDAGLRARLVDAVAAEFALRAGRCALLRNGDARLRTLYVGGGTPSLLEPELFARLLRATVGRLPAAPDLEATAEANPESLTPDVARAWREAGINRLSLGLQSLDDDVLRRLGRRADAATGRRALALALATFPRIGADWIVGPGVRPRRLAAELGEAVAAGVGHVSLYLLEVHDGTPWAADVMAGRFRMPSDGALEACYLAASEALDRLGLRQYEVANFARPGQESRHNRAYWDGTPYLGLGPGAHGFWGRRRYANLPDPAAYCREVEAGRLPEAQAETLGVAARRLERLILPLRTADGVALARVPLEPRVLAAGVAEGLWTVADDRLRLTPRGFLRLDAIEERLARALPPPGVGPFGTG